MIKQYEFYKCITTTTEMVEEDFQINNHKVSEKTFKTIKNRVSKDKNYKEVSEYTTYWTNKTNYSDIVNINTYEVI